jgi:hypothetical protein
MIPSHAIQFVTSNSFSGLGISVERTFRTEKLPGDVQGLASHNNNLLAVEQLLSHSTGQPTKEVTLAIDRDLYHTLQVSQVPLKFPSPSIEIFPTKKVLTSQVEAKTRSNLRLARRSTFCPASREDEKTDIEKVAGVLYLRNWWRRLSLFVVEVVLGFFGARSRSPNCEGRLAWFFSLRSRTQG